MINFDEEDNYFTLFENGGKMPKVKQEEFNEFLAKRSKGNYLNTLYSSRDLIKGKFSIKIADLGNAKDIDRNIGSSSICGTPLFMAPDIINLFQGELNEKENSYSLSADIWSLGTVFYEMLFGRPPFSAIHNKDIFRKILLGKYEVQKGTKISLEGLILLTGMLSYDREKRLNFEEIEKESFFMKDFGDFIFFDSDILLENENDENDKEIKGNFLIDSKSRSVFLRKIVEIFKFMV